MYGDTWLGLTPADWRALLALSQAACTVLTIGLLAKWMKDRHPGVLLASGVYGTGAYFSYANNDWWPLILAMGAGFFFRTIGFHLGYH